MNADEDPREVMSVAFKETADEAAIRELFEDDGDFLERDAHGDMARISLIQPLRRHFRRTGFGAFVSGNSAVFYDTWQNPIRAEARAESAESRAEAAEAKLARLREDLRKRGET